MKLNYQDLLSDFAQYLKKQGKSISTVDSYSRDAKGFLLFAIENKIEPSQITPETLTFYQQQLQESDKENSIRRKIIGTRQFFRFVSEQTLAGNSPFDDIPIPERHDDSPKSISSSHFSTLVKNLKKQGTLKARRDAAILNLIGIEGMKATELIELKWRNLIVTSDRASLHIQGVRQRTITIQKPSKDALLEYREMLQGCYEKRFDHVFIAFKGREGRGILNKMTRHGLKFLLYELGQEVSCPKLNTERLRNHAVSYLLASGVSPNDLMAHLGLRRLGNITWHLNKQTHA